jgi:hypothetical protein
VLNNWRKHVRGAGDMDPYSSAPWCSGWSELVKSAYDGWARAQPGVAEPWSARGPTIHAPLSARDADKTPLCPVVPSATWLGTVGWRVKSGLGAIKLGECPAGADWMRFLERAARSRERAAQSRERAARDAP